MPDFKAEIRARIAELGLPPVREAEIVEELSQHLTDEYEAAINRGASEEGARHAVFQELNAQCDRRCQLYHPDRRREHVSFAVHRESNRHRIAIQHQHAAGKDTVVARSREGCFRQTRQLVRHSSIRSKELTQRTG